MNDGHGAPSSRGVPHAEASANTRFVNTSTSPTVGESSHTAEIQVPRSPRPLSLQVDGLNAGIHGKYNSTPTYVESSERGSDTSGDSQRPDMQSASTFTDSVPSLLSSSLNESNRSMDDSFRTFDGNSQTRTTDQKPSSQEALQTLPVDGHGAIDDLNAAVKMEQGSNGSLSPLRSPKQSNSRSGTGMQFAPGHKRTVTGDIKSVSSNLALPHNFDVNGAARRRSKSTGSPAHGSRIAQLSVHIRTRLSYAAAKVEKARQSRETSLQLPLRGLEPLSSLSPPTSGGATPVPGSTPTSHPQYISKTTPTDTPRTLPTHHCSQSAISSPGKLLPIPKLAPPVDIISSNGDTRRRRPNPNLASKSFERSPYARHRRHHSQQEHSIAGPVNGSSSILGHGTPSIPPSYAPRSSRDGHCRPRTHSQNALMEQDAIETLLFMSSPENSGYRSSPRPLQPPATQRSLNESIYSNNSGMTTNQSQSSQSDVSHNGQGFPSKNHGLGLEAGAGDEIDRLLDQMESDSEDDARFASHRPGIKRQTFRGHHGQSR